MRKRCRHDAHRRHGRIAISFDFAGSKRIPPVRSVGAFGDRDGRRERARLSDGRRGRRQWRACDDDRHRCRAPRRQRSRSERCGIVRIRHGARCRRYRRARSCDWRGGVPLWTAGRGVRQCRDQCRSGICGYTGSLRRHAAKSRPRKMGSRDRGQSDLGDAHDPPLGRADGRPEHWPDRRDGFDRPGCGPSRSATTPMPSRKPASSISSGRPPSNWRRRASASTRSLLASFTRISAAGD